MSTLLDIYVCLVEICWLAFAAEKWCFVVCSRGSVFDFSDSHLFSVTLLGVIKRSVMKSAH